MLGLQPNLRLLFVEKIMNMDQAIQELNALWKQQGEHIYQFNANQSLWHSGVIDFQNSKQSVVTWFTPNSDQQDFHNNWPIDAEKRGHGAAYKTELSSESQLRLANFNRVHFHAITVNYLDRSHGNLNLALFQFCHQNNLDGIIRGEEGNEIALRSDKLQTLMILNKTKL